MATAPEILQAQKDATTYNIPYAAYTAFRAHFNNAKRRKIEFHFTLETWWKWWSDNNWEERGLKGNGYVMARIGDTGPYSVENVYLATAGQNAKDTSSEVRSKAIKESCEKRNADPDHVWHLAVRGDDHPRSKAVLTPKGRFGSAALAAEAHAITRQHAGRLAKAGKNGWSYECDPVEEWDRDGNSSITP